MTTSLLTAAIRVPDHVVYRQFAEETVVLNLETGMYHGLNTTAAAMLEQAAGADHVGAVVPTLARRLGTDTATVEHDLLSLCAQLRERGLIEVLDRTP